MKPLLVVNPRSGRGRTGETFGAMRGTIERALGEVEVAFTERPGHGTELAERGAIAGHPLVVAVGGDGTFHEVVNGLMRARTAAPEARVGLIAQGTGGDFRKSLGLEHRLDHYLAALSSGRERKIDVGGFKGGGKDHHYFVNILSCGMSGLVDKYVADAPRALSGKAAYFGASARALVGAKLGHVRCTVTRDGERTEHTFRSFMVAICNGAWFGGGMNVAPMAEIDDGVLELVALGTTSKLALAVTSNAIYSGAHMKQKTTVHLRGQVFELDLANEDARDSFLLDVDGEPMGGLPLRVELHPAALTLRA